jgi:hypothetical protein
LNSDYKVSNIRLREGEHQYSLAKAIATFQLELYFPDVKDIVRKLYGEQKADDVQFVRKIQTILKKMERSGIVKILPKKTPWDLQRYALSSLKFQDVDRNLVILATDPEIKQSGETLRYISVQRPVSVFAFAGFKVRVLLVVLLMVASYGVSVWSLVQPVISPFVFVPAFGVAVVCSVMLGRVLSSYA